MGIRDGFRFGLGLWFATMLVGTVWLVIMLLIGNAIMG
ncbi:hypothetical protein ES705_20094 [subsurface metagenome]